MKKTLYRATIIEFDPNNREDSAYTVDFSSFKEEERDVFISEQKASFTEFQQSSDVHAAHRQVILTDSVIVNLL